MGTNHLFKNVRTLTIALTLCAALAVAMTIGCKKDDIRDITYDTTITVLEVTRGYTMVDIESWPSRTPSKDVYFAIDTLPRISWKTSELAKRFEGEGYTVKKYQLKHYFDGPKRYYITPYVKDYVGSVETYVCGETVTYDVPVSTALEVHFVATDITATSATVTLNFTIPVKKSDLMMTWKPYPSWWEPSFEVDREPYDSEMEKGEHKCYPIILPKDFYGTSYTVYLDDLTPGRQYRYYYDYGFEGKEYDTDSRYVKFFKTPEK